MSNESTIRANIKTAIQTVTNVGVVYDYLRFASIWNDFLDLFKTTISGSDVIRGWHFTCNGLNPAVERETFGDTGLLTRNYQYKVLGYAGLDDSAATEKTFFAITELVLEALSNHIVGGEDNIPTLTTFEPRTFGGVVCHFAEITMTVEDDYSA